MSSSCLLFCILSFPLLVSATWHLGAEGESCSQTCSERGQECSETTFMLRNAEINSKNEMSQVITGLNGSCVVHNLNYGLNADVPVYQASSKVCYVSASYREEDTFDCSRKTTSGKQRLCWCHEPGAAAKLSSDVDDKDEGDASGSLSGGLIIWIISGNMCFLALVGMAFGIVRRYITKGEAAKSSAKERPADTGFYVRCPACGCPLGESRSVTSYQVTQSRPFKAGDCSSSQASESHGTSLNLPKMHLGESTTPKSTCTAKSALRSSNRGSLPNTEEMQNVV